MKKIACILIAVIMSIILSACADTEEADSDLQDAQDSANRASVAIEDSIDALDDVEGSIDYDGMSEDELNDLASQIEDIKSRLAEGDTSASETESSIQDAISQLNPERDYRQN
jgi:chromosome segregation ATPase